MLEGPILADSGSNVLSGKVARRSGGFSQIPNVILDALQAANLPCREWNLVTVILRKTYGWHKVEDWISISQFVAVTGIDHSGVCRCLKSLTEKGVLTKKESGKRRLYRVNTDIGSWTCLRPTVVADETTSSGRTDNQVVAVQPPTKETLTIETPTKENTPSASDDAEVLSLVRLFREEVLKNKPNRRLTPRWDSQTYRAIQKLIEEDGRPPDAIKRVILYSQSDNVPHGSNGFCWAPVITDGDKLRKHFDTLEDAMNRMSVQESESLENQIDWEMVLANLQTRLTYHSFDDPREREDAEQCVSAYMARGMQAFKSEWQIRFNNGRFSS